MSGGANAAAGAGDPPPNIVVIFADDLGYGDVGCYGAKGYRTPNLDRMATEGVRFTQFYVAQAVCSASRAGLMTGCYPNRVGISGALGPHARHGINADETTVAEVLKQKGYATAAFGKWHLGHHPRFLPVRHGFDEYYGLPYSNDMWPHHPEARPGTYPPLPMIENDRTVDPEVTPEDQHSLTTAYTERAVRFIEKSRDRPFFLYLAHSMVHVPLFVSDTFAGKTERGLFGDVMSEVDWSVGEVLSALKRHDLDPRTLVIFTSDNGPWLSYGDHAGTAGPLREGKGTAFEGGVREPFIARWPGRIPAGRVCEEPAMTIDLLPTFARLAGAGLPERKIDGLDIWPLLAGAPGAKTPHEAFFFYYANNELRAVRSGEWKLHFPHTSRTMKGQEPGRGGRPGKYRSEPVGQELYHLAKDQGESIDVAAQNPDVVKRLEALAEGMRGDLGDSLTRRKPTGAREPGRLPATE